MLFNDILVHELGSAFADFFVCSKPFSSNCVYAVVRIYGGEVVVPFVPSPDCHTIHPQPQEAAVLSFFIFGMYIISHKNVTINTGITFF